VLAGKFTYVTEPLEPPESERVLLCCAQPVGEITLEL
jgi:hypothetical protein